MLVSANSRMELSAHRWPSYVDGGMQIGYRAPSLNGCQHYFGSGVVRAVANPDVPVSALGLTLSVATFLGTLSGNRGARQ